MSLDIYMHEWSGQTIPNLVHSFPFPIVWEINPVYPLLAKV